MIASMNRTVAVIPARGGSKGIPRKNIRLLHGAPLISHAVRAASDALGRDRVFVSTDDEGIASMSRRLGVQVIERPRELAGDAITLDPVIFHAMETIADKGISFDFVATIQPTSPLLRPETIRASVERLVSDDLDTVLAVTEDRHLRWAEENDRGPVPLFRERVNRQQLPMEFREAGALLLTRREHITASNRFGPKVGLIALSESEAVDIDGYPDWWLADNYLNHRRIAVRVDGGGPLGLGHVYRQLTLLERLTNHEVRFFMDRELVDGVELAESRQVSTSTAKADELAAMVRAWCPDIILIDKLDTEIDEVEGYKSNGAFVVTFEDLGSGSDGADMVFNGLYEDGRADGHRVFSGPEVVCLREEFHVIPPKAPRPVAEHILLTFGGTDPNDLTSRALRTAMRLDPGVRITVVLGRGYPYQDRVEELVRSLAGDRRVDVIRDTSSMSELMWSADFAVTSAGRTVFEALACSTPCIVMAQNMREMRHTSADEGNGVINLGLGAEVSDTELLAALSKMLDFETRARMQELTMKLDLLDGPETIIFSIFREFGRRERRMSRARLLEWIGAPKGPVPISPFGDTR